VLYFQQSKPFMPFVAKDNDGCSCIVYDRSVLITSFITLHDIQYRRLRIHHISNAHFDLSYPYRLTYPIALAAQTFLRVIEQKGARGKDSKMIKQILTELRGDV
jgi:hypothetical protein